jgi:hypothetical protein
MINTDYLKVPFHKGVAFATQMSGYGSFAISLQRNDAKSFQ